MLDDDVSKHFETIQDNLMNNNEIPSIDKQEHD